MLATHNISGLDHSLRSDLANFEPAGVRLEDDLLVTATGTRSLTNVPRTAADLESVMAGGEWPPAAKAKDAA